MCLLCCKKGEKVSTPLDKDGRDPCLRKALIFSFINFISISCFEMKFIAMFFGIGTLHVQSIITAFAELSCFVL